MEHSSRASGGRHFQLSLVVDRKGSYGRVEGIVVAGENARQKVEAKEEEDEGNVPGIRQLAWHLPWERLDRAGRRPEISNRKGYPFASQGATGD